MKSIQFRCAIWAVYDALLVSLYEYAIIAFLSIQIEMVSILPNPPPLEDILNTGQSLIHSTPSVLNLPIHQ